MPTVFNKLSSQSFDLALQQVIALDILGLLNCAVRSARLDAPQNSPLLSSVLNYGNPVWTSLGSSRIDPFQLANDIQATIVKFEPRLQADSLKVKTRLDTDRSRMQDLYFDLQAEIKGSKNIFRLRLSLDYQSSSFSLSGE